MCPDLLRHAEQFVDITLAITDVKAAPRSIQKLRGLLQIIKPPDALLLLNGNARRIDLFLQRSGPLELLPEPVTKSRVPKFAPGNFPINPAFSAVDRPRSCPSRSIPQY